MRGVPRLTVFALAALCWLTAGPGGGTVREVLACRHHAMHHMAGQHASSPADGPCFCDEMTGQLDLAVSTAVPTPLGQYVVILPPVADLRRAVPFPLPHSPSFAPTPPPPIGLG
jgi:hypothetical protein